jgi:hypothetical protein
MMEQVRDAVSFRLKKVADEMAGPIKIVRHPSGSERWAIRVAWKNDIVSEFELVGRIQPRESVAALSRRLDEAVFRPFPQPGTWSTRVA